MGRTATAPAGSARTDDGGRVVSAEALRGVWRSRVALAPGVTLEDEPTGASVMRIPRRNPLERAFARLLHGRDTRLRLEVPDKGRAVLEAIRAAGPQGRPVKDLAHDRRLQAADPSERGPEPDLDDGDTVAFLAFILALVRSRVLLLDTRDEPPGARG